MAASTTPRKASDVQVETPEDMISAVAGQLKAAPGPRLVSSKPGVTLTIEPATTETPQQVAPQMMQQAVQQAMQQQASVQQGNIQQGVVQQGNAQQVQLAKPAHVASGGAQKATPQPQTSPIEAFLELEIAARKAEDLNSLRFLIVNGIRRLVGFDQSLIAEPSGNGKSWKVTAVSDVSGLDRDAPFMRDLEAFIAKDVASIPGYDERPQVLQGPGETPANEGEIREDGIWCFWLPMLSPQKDLMAGLMLMRTSPWRPQEKTLLTSLTDVFSHAWVSLQGRRLVAPSISKRKGLVAAVSLVAATLIGLIPVSLTALAPSEVIGTDPVVVGAPIDGVVQDIARLPNETVEQGALLFNFVDVKLRNDMEVANKQRMVAEAKYFKILQLAVTSSKDNQDLAVAKAELSQAEAELAYAKEMLSRSKVRAPQAGVLLYSAKSDWIGKPVTTGERIMEIADPSKVEIRVDLPVADAIALKEGSRVKLFLDGDPMKPVEATLTRSSYRATPSADKQLVFRVYANLQDMKNPPRIGARGTAQVHGEKVSLAFYLFRRPLALLRQKVGL